MEEYEFSVVEFIDRPHHVTDKYVCVPSLWIKTSRETDKKVGVLYPEGSKSAIESLVGKRQKIRSSMHADEYLCELLYNTNSYNDAKIFIMMKITSDRKKELSTSHIRKDSGEKIRRSTLNTASLPTMKELRSINSLKRRHCVCNTNNVQNVSRPVNSQVNPKTIAFLNDIGTLTAKLADVIKTFADSFNDSTYNTKYLEPSQMDDEDIDYTSDEAKSPRKKRLPSFDLPTEYDAKDTRWTLKHRGPGDNLKELIPDSKVYIDDGELVSCLEHSQNELQLTRSLLVALFNEKALQTCSITGCKAYAHKAEEIRPGLDRDAKDAMIYFVHWHAQQNGWEVESDPTLNNCIRNKLTEFRKKKQKANKRNSLL